MFAALITFILLGFINSQAAVPNAVDRITIQLLNSRNGRPILTQDVQVVIDHDLKHIYYAHTDQNGVATVEVPTGAMQVSVFAQQGGWGLNRCDSRETPMPQYFLEQIRLNGLAAPNYCNHRTATAVPGELVVFFRSQTFWEKMKV